MRQNLNRIQFAIDNEEITLNKQCAGWAAWDDLYNFVEDHNPDFIKDNFVDENYISSEVNIFAIINNSGQIVYAGYFDFESGQELPLSDETQQALTDSFLLSRNVEKGKIGILDTAEGPLLIGTSPILTGRGEGPVRGTMIMGRFLDSMLIDKLSFVTKLPIAIKQLPDINPENAAGDFPLLSPEKPVSIQPVSSETLAGYLLISDIYGKPYLIGGTQTPRDVYSEARKAFIWLLIGIALVAVFIIFVIVRFLDRLVLSRLRALSDFATHISRKGDFSARVTLGGKDELTTLGGEINAMLTRLAESYQKEIAYRQELEEEAKTRTQFINVLAHELRNPLTPILVSLEMGRDSLDANHDCVQYKLFMNALQGAEMLRNRLEELLDMVRFSRGGFTLNISPINTGEFLKTVALRYSPAFEEKQQQMIINLPAALPRIEADHSRLEQVIINLLSNASKYSPENTEITLQASEIPQGILVEIKDKGTGIPPEDLEKVFEPYHRVEQTRQRYPGIGLGLTVCKQIIEAHQGRIWIESEIGKGSTFKFVLPFKKKEQVVAG